MNRQQLLMIYEAFLLALAILIGGLLAWDLTSELTATQQYWFTVTDRLVVMVYAADYIVRLVCARDRRRFFLRHFPELIAIIPFDRAFRLARLLRIQRLLPLFRAYRVLMFSRRAWVGFLDLVTTNNFHHVVIFAAFTVLLSAVGILHFEPQVKTFGDALWWSMVTLSTVGYGDIAPHTVEGRLIAVILMMVGLGVLAIFTGTVSTLFLRRMLAPAEKLPENRTSRGIIARAIMNRLTSVGELESGDAEEIVELAQALKTVVEADDKRREEGAPPAAKREEP